MKKDVLIKTIIVILISTVVFGLVLCKCNRNHITPESFESLYNANWMTMDQKEMEEHLDVKGIVDKEETEEWGEGFKVVDFPGADKSTYLHVVFSENENGDWSCSSMQPFGELKMNNTVGE